MRKNRTPLAFILAAALMLTALAGCSEKASAPPQPKSADPGAIQTVDLSALQKRLTADKGKVTFVMFWATWCPACKSELPTLEKLRAKYPAEKLDILAISLDDTAADMKTFLSKQRLGVPVFLSKPEVGTAYGVSSIPALYIYDKKGKVAFNSVGAYPFEMLDAVIGPLVKAS